ncbi:MAG: glycosyltransferase [Bacteroidia bacterium]|nr:glycosyltransferase [Bacteroidia bacterium]
MTKFISVVTSAYNAEKYIAEAIESVLNQSYPHFEFIIENDGSTDATLEIIKKIPPTGFPDHPR